LPLIADDLQAAARRGVKVVGRVYEAIALKGVVMLVTQEAERVRSVWPGEQLSIATDGDQFLMALLAQNSQSVHQAVWSNSTFLSCMQYNALHTELLLTQLQTGERAGLEGLSLTRLKPPGFERLNARYSEAPVARRAKR
jgi:hypothetical protein